MPEALNYVRSPTSSFGRSLRCCATPNSNARDHQQSVGGVTRLVRGRQSHRITMVMAVPFCLGLKSDALRHSAGDEGGSDMMATCIACHIRSAS